jgi:hypothetical protein
LVFVLSIPLWLIGALTPLQLLPGLPVSSLMSFCPLIAASILVYSAPFFDFVDRCRPSGTGLIIRL